MAGLVLSSEFLAAYARLPRHIQRAAVSVITKFQEHTHAGLHLEKLRDACDSRIRTIRVNDFWRGVILALGQRDYVWITIMAHDDANTYAANRAFSVNQKLGVLEVRDQKGIEALEQAAGSGASGGLFDEFSDGQLESLGIDPKLIPCIRAFTTEPQFNSFGTVLPSTQFDVLSGLAAGLSVEQVGAELAERIVPQVDVDDLVAAAHRTPERFKFVSGPVELAAILQHPFDAWRIFLHPTQHDIAYRETYSGAAQVTGSAGTGKTVTGLHRAVYLASRLPDDGSKVLLTTFTRTLATTLRRQLGKLTEDKAVRDRIDVTNVDRLARETVSAHGKPPEIADELMMRHAFDLAAGSGPSRFSRTGEVIRCSGAFLRREWEQVILAQGLTSADAYRSATRHGRGEALPAAQRDQIWAAISQAVDELARHRRYTYLQLAEQAAVIAEDKGSNGYRHVVVDEAQDLHPAQWRLLRAMVPPGPDDMFLLADPHQRIYDNHVSLKSLGIEVRGRSRRLTINYRTTHEILHWSVKVLTGARTVGLDDSSDTLDGYRSVTHGTRPEVRGFRDRTAELDALIERVGTWLELGVEPHAIGVAARTNGLVNKIAKSLQDADIPVAKDSDDSSGVQVATMHSMKGLEFQCLAVAGLDATELPALAAITSAAEDQLSHEQDVQRERCLLFVAVTRARDMLHLSHTGAPSSLLPA